MDQTKGPIKQRSCYKCGFQGETADTFCPQCRRRLQTSSSIRVRGALLVVCGVILTGMMGYISLWTLSVFNNDAPSQARFTGTQQEKQIIISLFAVLILFGVMSLITGLWQLILGRRNKLFVWAVLGLGLLIAIGGGAVIWLFD